MPREWIVLCLAVGVVVGIGTVVQGWHFKATVGGLLVWGAGQLSQWVPKQQDVVEGAKRLASAAHLLHIPQMAYWITWGALGSGALLLAVGYSSVFLSDYLHNRREGQPDAFALAGHRAAQYFTHGLRAYLSIYSTGALEGQKVFNKRRAFFNELLIGAIRKTVVGGDRRREAVREQIANVARTMLLLLFERDQALLQDFRLGVYIVSADEERFDLWAAADREDWEAHSPEPLLRHASFMGSSLDEGRPLVFPRDKKGHAMQKRGRSRWKSFLVVPLPCDTSPQKWGAIAIDHTGNDAVFDLTRMDIVRDFARYVEILHTVSQEQEART